MTEIRAPLDAGRDRSLRHKRKRYARRLPLGNVQASTVQELDCLRKKPAPASRSLRFGH